MNLDYIALALLIFVALVIFYGVIVIHDIPYEIAKKRNHPHQDAIHHAGWVSLFTLHVLWPFLWIWATLWQHDRGWGMSTLEHNQESIQEELNALKKRVQELEKQPSSTPPSQDDLAPKKGEI
ncbi:GTPase [Enterovibrio norvegicus FF-33]|uniref:GTPase n=1 Tax=Enterovibrio norvegicus FF-454 TaxID=1185651 RepID=A0A1E5C7P9_9GAMM|nr:DUF3302 domain-containing protein [Enterovibrio norvegicus]OEE61499.1 GTPase [Enterovibrio norvegicus FF-454]OEE66198.1 GTPase [Enterovibrio norvegicus FF-33]OEE74826.1 GTPase [Enterovibrio norvegicus FF-162]